MCVSVFFNFYTTRKTICTFPCDRDITTDDANAALAGITQYTADAFAFLNSRLRFASMMGYGERNRKQKRDKRIDRENGGQGKGRRITTFTHTHIYTHIHSLAHTHTHTHTHAHTETTRRAVPC